MVALCLFGFIMSGTSDRGLIWTLWVTANRSIRLRLSLRTANWVSPGLRRAAELPLPKMPRQQCHGGEWALLCSLETGQPSVADPVELRARKDAILTFSCSSWALHLRAAGLSSVPPELSHNSLSSLVQWGPPHSNSPRSLGGT